MKFLFILNDPPYGTERAYNALRLAINLLVKTEGAEVSVFLLGDGASASKSGQQTPNGYYNIERMLTSVLNKGGAVKVCGTCMDARGITESELVAGAHRSTMDELTELTSSTDKVLVF
ncbi:sulfur transfer complex subunit TusD [mine drainage metagenome]|uniref:Sulfur transfer complex subunit TusD n=1 Tax=mine drainage metagenome TaxID=410659 RepID=A0A1J5QF15_9ZZZZ